MDLMLFARSMGGLGAVLALLAAATWIVRRHDIRLPGRVGLASRGRIGVVERVTVDAKRSLLLIRQDGTEHLLLLSPEGHVVIGESASSPAERPRLDGSTRSVDQPEFRFEPWLEPANDHLILRRTAHA
ncbi:flagellar biosynthetic protein FliO [Sphingobium subterraneum]|uniref:Flagellar biogenesis protein FliO n=1 Tax=Sphingobium subterraneum TaxID=627688 RepID=A0A841IZB8_9SPHN|nr:flagellar biosynthetic protein FliO [Sphingobium subterraneum]MBB6124309.1 hypothetical protein [Sphingobium subterraneum]